MSQDIQTLNLSENEGVDRLDEMDRFFRRTESEPILVDFSGVDLIPTPVLQMILCAAQHWTQRDISFSVTGASIAMRENLALVGADLTPYMNEEAR